MNSRAANFFVMIAARYSFLLVLILVGLPGVSLEARPGEISRVERRTAFGSHPIPFTFASSIAVSKHLVFVGDSRWNPYHDDGVSLGQNFGAVIVFNLLNPYAPVQGPAFNGLDTHDESLFGASVAADGGLVVAGAPQQDGGIGAAYLFEIHYPNNPVECYKMVASDRANGAKFGGAVAISGTRVLVGSIGPGSGRAYLFDVSNPNYPVEQAKIEAPVPVTGDGFGQSVAIDGDLVLIGAVPTGAEGHAYLFDISNPTSPQYRAALSATQDASVDNRFGVAVALSGNLAAAGAPGRDDPGVGDDSGALYVFDVTTPASPSGVQVLASDRSSGLKLGESVSIAGSKIVSGASGNFISNVVPAAYCFEASNPAAPVEIAKLVPNSLGVFGGVSVGADGKIAVVGPVSQSGDPAAGVFNLSDDLPLVETPTIVTLQQQRSAVEQSGQAALDALGRKIRKASKISKKKKKKKKVRRLKKNKIQLIGQMNGQLSAIDAAIAQELNTTFH